MNLRIATGFITAAPEDAWTAPAPGAQSQRRVIFDLHVTDSLGREWPERCIIEDIELQATALRRLQPGSIILIEAEPTARPHERGGVKTGGWLRELRVRRMEILRATQATDKTKAVA